MVDHLTGDETGIKRAAELIRDGGIVAFPTETFYGLAADPRNGAALERLKALKQRPEGSAFPLIAADLATAKAWVDIPTPFEALTARFWPGPLTLAVHPTSKLDPAVCAEHGSVGRRLAEHPVARTLAQHGGGVITATSANPRGDPPPKSAETLSAGLVEQLSAVIDGGVTAGGSPSTIVGLRQGRVVILRPGRISSEEIAAVLGYTP